MTKPILQSTLCNPKSIIACLALAWLLLFPSGAWPCGVPAFSFSNPALAPPPGPAPGSNSTDGEGVDLSTGLGIVRTTLRVLLMHPTLGMYWKTHLGW